MGNQIPNQLRIRQVLNMYEKLTPEERKIVNEQLGLVFKSPVDKLFDAYERLTVEERADFEELRADSYCDCGEELPENEEDHDCPLDHEPEVGEEDEENGEDEDEDEAPPSSDAPDSTSDPGESEEDLDDEEEPVEDGFDGD